MSGGRKLALPRRRYRPFTRTGRGAIAAILATFALIAVVTLTLSIRATSGAQHQATLVEIVARQRTLAERYLSEVLLVRAGRQADPAATAAIMSATVSALLRGGSVPAVLGNDDSSTVSPISGAWVRRQLTAEGRLVRDLSAYGSALLAGRQLSTVPHSGGEHITTADPLTHLRVLAGLTSDVALDASRTIAAQANHDVAHLRTFQIVLQVIGGLVSLLLALGLVATTRRQSAHFRSLVTSSSDLIWVLGTSGCLYVSRSLCRIVGRGEQELLGAGLREAIHPDDVAAFDEAGRSAEPSVLMLRIRNAAGEWRHLETQLTDLRGDRHLRGVVLSARDATERLELEEALRRQSRSDAFGSQLTEALEMVDEEHGAYDLVERAISMISADAPTELLLADSSRAHLRRVASSPTAGAPGCDVTSPFSCVAVRRGQAVTFESSEALNACPKLRGRAGGACSAVCVPVGFMGRALGVLHATGPEGVVPPAEQVARLTTLGAQAGGRIGTLRAFEKTQLQAATDGLTGLLNRRTCETRIRDLIAGRRLFALAVADLDRFKQLNDTFGHEAGDAALRRFAQLAQSALREQDLLARWGGEEFVIVLPEIDASMAVAILDRIREQLAAPAPTGHPTFTVSFGVTDSAATDGLEQMLRVADAGLYASKQAGRDRVTIGDPDAADATLEALREVEAEMPGRETGRQSPLPPMLHEAASEPDPRPSGVEIR